MRPCDQTVNVDNFTTALFFTISDGQDQDRLYPISRYINFCVMVITAN